MGLLPDTQNCGLRMRRGCRESFPRHRLQRTSLVSDPDMHHGTCVTHVPWCMSGSVNRGGGENFPGIPGACTTRHITYLARGPFIWAANTCAKWAYEWLEVNLFWRVSLWPSNHRHMWRSLKIITTHQHLIDQPVNACLDSDYYKHISANRPVGGIVRPATFYELRYGEFAPESRALCRVKNWEIGFITIWSYFGLVCVCIS